ncbi:MAG: pilus assembly protein PilM [Acidobacteria bacterium]|nr:pilus assembly protein PilM [Acidobacteriota bacterium]
MTGVALSGSQAAWTVASHASERLPAGAVTPALNAANIHDDRVVAGALRSLFDKMSVRPRRVALVIPDTAAKVSLVRFEKVPAGAADLDQLIRWQVRKAAPFKAEEAQISWVPAAALPDGGREFLVTTARRDLIEQYERVCSAAGAHAGVVDLASLNLINAALASAAQAAAGDWLIVNVAQDYATLVIVRGKEVIFFRTRHLEADGDLADLVHQTAMYHEDRLAGGRFARVVLSGASARGLDVGERVRRGLEERLGSRVEALDFRGSATMRDRIGAGAELLDTLAPAVGVVLRERVA